jgi:hypothetical protein
MRKLMVVLTVTAAILSIAGLTWKAEAATGLGKAAVNTAAESYMPTEKAACWPGQRDYCPYHMKRVWDGSCRPCRHGPGY